MTNEIEIVKFAGDEVQAIRNGDKVHIVVKRICEILGIDESGQRQKLQNKAWATAGMTSAVAQDGKIRDLFCIPLEAFPMWMATIDSNRVAEGLRAKLEKYQCECAKVLYDHFFTTKQPGREITQLDELLAGLPHDSYILGIYTSVCLGVHSVQAGRNSITRHLKAVYAGTETPTAPTGQLTAVPKKPLLLSAGELGEAMMPKQDAKIVNIMLEQANLQKKSRGQCGYLQKKGRNGAK